MSADLALRRLADPHHAAAADLARLWVTAALDLPLRSAVSPEQLAATLRDAILASTRQAELRAACITFVQDARSRAAQDPRPLSALLPADALPPLRAAVGRPYAPSEALTLRLLDQPAVRALVRDVLVDVLDRFRAKAQAIDGGLLGAIGAKAAHRGRGLFGSLGERFGDVARVGEGLVGAVKEEVEHAFDTRVRDFARQGTADVLAMIANDLARPDLAPSFAEARVGALNALLATPLSELAVEADRAGLEQAVDALLDALRAAAEAPTFTATAAETLRAALDAAGDPTLGAWLSRVALRERVTEAAVVSLTDPIRATARSEAFAAWWSALHAPEPSDR